MPIKIIRMNENAVVTHGGETSQPISYEEAITTAVKHAIEHPNEDITIQVFRTVVVKEVPNAT